MAYNGKILGDQQVSDIVELSLQYRYFAELNVSSRRAISLRILFEEILR